MSVDDRHINFKLMREWILAHQDQAAGQQPPTSASVDPLADQACEVSSSAANGKKYWRSLDQLYQTPEFQQWLNQEFPDSAAEIAALRARPIRPDG